jgi:hypothetical protein
MYLPLDKLIQSSGKVEKMPPATTSDYGLTPQLQKPVETRLRDVNRGRRVR